MGGCVRCGRDNPVGAQFCNACGAALGESDAGGVRKTVTVVFCDLVGSTALGERTDPEVLRELMARYHNELRRVLERYGGTVEKFIGDAAMAVFGIPQVHEDDALRAVRAALAVRQVVHALGLEVRIGVNTGEVVTGSGETLVTGDAVNVAARLEQVASAGEVLIGQVTHQLVAAQVRTEPVPALQLRGKSEPVPAFRVLEALRDVPAFTRPIDAPFVGRAAELGMLFRALEAAVDTRTPQLVTVVGPPGIGKSRLARELVTGSSARVSVGRCLSYGEGITYWPLAEIVEQLGDVPGVLAGQPDAELAAERVAAAVGAAGALVSPEEIAWAFRRLFEAAAADGPLIVVFDDIHWAEPTLLDLIEYLATFTRDAPLLLLCTARVDLFVHRADWATPKSNATVLSLEALAAADIEQLVGELRDVSAEVRARIVEVAEGNPLFVEQLVAMQADTKEWEVPASLQALLAARIDRLDPGERTVVECGAVEGRLFHRGTVAALTPPAERGQLGAHLLALVRKEFIRPDSASLPGDDGFRFAHMLVRDAVYSAVPKRQRARLHERFADSLTERVGVDAPAEILGYHLEQAYRYHAELGAADQDLGRRAADHLARGGRAARLRDDVHAAANLLGRALALCPADSPDRPQLLVEFGYALHRAGELARADEVLRQATELARAANDQHAEWLARIDHAVVRLRRQPDGAMDAARTEAETAVATVDPADHEVLARAWAVLAEPFVHLMRSDVDTERDEPAIYRAFAHARHVEDPVLRADVVTRFGPLIVYGSLPVSDGLRQLDDIIKEMGDIPAVQAFVRHVRGHLWARIGDFEAARDALASWGNRFHELGQESEYAVYSTCMWDVCALAGDWSRGERVLREGYEIVERLDDTDGRATIAAQLADAVYRQGRVDEADELSRITEQLSAADDHWNQALWRIVRANVLAARGNYEPAVALAQEALRSVERTDCLDQRADIRLDLAAILAIRDRDQARETAREAVAMYERKGNLVGVARAKLLLT